MSTESSAHTVGVELRFDVTGTPDEIAEVQQKLMDAVEALGGMAARASVGEPETDTRTELEKRLAEPLEVDREISHNHRLRVIGLLRSQGIEWVGDAVALGERRLRLYAPIGDKVIIPLRNDLQTAPVPLPLKERPDEEFIASVFKDPTQLPIQVVFNGMLVEVDGYGGMDNRVTLQDALNNTEQFRTRVDLEKQSSVCLYARRFLEKVQQAKQAS